MAGRGEHIPLLGTSMPDLLILQEMLEIWIFMGKLPVLKCWQLIQKTLSTRSDSHVWAGLDRQDISSQPLVDAVLPCKGGLCCHIRPSFPLGLLSSVSFIFLFISLTHFFFLLSKSFSFKDREKLFMLLFRFP